MQFFVVPFRVHPIAQPSSPPSALSSRVPVPMSERYILPNYLNVCKSWTAITHHTATWSTCLIHMMNIRVRNCSKSSISIKIFPRITKQTKIFITIPSNISLQECYSHWLPCQNTPPSQDPSPATFQVRWQLPKLFSVKKNFIPIHWILR